jgi:hypothetical protein
VVLSGSSGRFGQLRWNVYGCFSIDGLIEKSESSHFFPVFQCLPAKVLSSTNKCPQDIKAQAYISLVRPHFEYASSVWDPFRKGHIAASPLMD